MASCDLEIALERTDATFQVGEPIRGVIGVTVDKSCTCKALTVWVEWYTHGSGNKTQGPSGPIVLFEGEWAAGEKHLYPFEIRLPAGPLPYHGHHLNVDWRVVATAAIPWGFDPRAEAELVVRDDPAVAVLDHGPLADVTLVVHRASKFALASAGVIAMVVGGSMALGGPCIGLGVANEDGAGTGLLVGVAFSLVPLIFVGVGGWLVFTAIGPMLAARRLGEPEVSVEPSRLRGGDSVAVRVAMKPRRPTAIRAIWAVVIAQERCVSGSGTKTRTHTHEVWRERVSLGDPRMVLANVEVTFAGVARIPPDPAPSFAATSNVLEWWIEVQAELPNGPDWVSRHPLTVRP